MDNVFPVAQKAAIEETIGFTRPSASPPAGQGVRGPHQPRKQVSLFNARPKWLNMQNISKFERNFMDSTEQEASKYMEIRNKIIEMHETSGTYVPFRSILETGNDYVLAAKIYDFLEDNKIINFNIGLCEALEDVDRNGLEEALAAEEPSRKKTVELYVDREVFVSARCHCGKQAGYFSSGMEFLCIDCFGSEQFPKEQTKKNYHRITESFLSTMWTRREEYILLRNIESVGDDWTRVCEGLNKTVDQCIFHFVKMSILDDGTMRFEQQPFMSVPNPISTFVAFVCSMIYPSISTELAKTAIKYLNSPNLMEILMGIARERGEEVLATERKKLVKLKKVEIEAMIKRVMLKVEVINEMYAEAQTVRNELVEQRERLVEEAMELQSK